MKGDTVALEIRSKFCELPDIIMSNYFFIENQWELNEMTEHQSVRTERIFYLKHPQANEMIKALGEQGTFTFIRVILSFFDAAHKLNRLWRKFSPYIKQADYTYEELNAKALDYNVEDFNFYSLDVSTVLCSHDTKTSRTYYPYKNAEINELFESLYAMNINHILDHHGLQTYPNTLGSTMNISDYDSVITKMLVNREIGMVMHNWRKLNNYKNVDFISNTSKILEIIKLDIKKNEEKFGMPDEFSKLKKLVAFVEGKDQKINYSYLFDGIFNDADNLGFISRHGSNKRNKEIGHLVDYNDISTEDLTDANEIAKRLRDQKIIPSFKEFKHLYNFWHLTTSLIVFYWYRCRKIA